MKKRINVTCSINLALDRIEIRPASAEPRSTGNRILVVEDNAFVREMYSDVLVSAGQITKCQDFQGPNLSKGCGLKIPIFP